MNKIVVVCGPTGIGKTSFSIALATKFKAEIIGADSMQIYKYMDIGTAKPTPGETQKVRHHLIDFLDPAQNFDAGQYIQMADEAIGRILKKQKLPIIAGGTGLYIKALLHGLFRARPVCVTTLEGLNRLLEEKGNLFLYRQLEELDPDTARKLHPNDAFRVIRALEVLKTTGEKISQHQGRHEFNTKRYDYLKIGLFLDRKKLYERINKRVDIMLNDGLLSEVVSLVDRGYSLELKSMQSIGYRHMGLFLKKEVDFKEAVRLLKRDTRRYAKRQFTWFNQDKEIQWLRPDQTDEAAALVKEFLT